jgi:hypothetical protein
MLCKNQNFHLYIFVKGRALQFVTVYTVDVRGVDLGSN